MSMEIAKQSAPQFTAEQLKLITSTVAKGASPDELQLFLYRCKNMGLDPLKPGQIHFIKYGPGPGTMVVGIDGLRSVANRSGKWSGVKRGVLRSPDGICIGGWAEVYRSDWQHPARTEVSMAEYNSGKGPWQKMPESMIQKVAEAGALRMAFPDDTAGLYTQEEMDQAGRGVRPGRPDATDGVQSEEYCCSANLGGKFGRLRLKRVSEADPALMREAVQAIEEKARGLAQKKNDPKWESYLPNWAIEFIKQAEPYIARYEQSLSGDGSFEDFEPGAKG